MAQHANLQRPRGRREAGLARAGGRNPARNVWAQRCGAGGQAHRVPHGIVW